MDIKPHVEKILNTVFDCGFSDSMFNRYYNSTIERENFPNWMQNLDFAEMFEEHDPVDYRTQMHDYIDSLRDIYWFDDQNDHILYAKKDLADCLETYVDELEESEEFKEELQDLLEEHFGI